MSTKDSDEDMRAKLQKIADEYPDQAGLAGLNAKLQASLDARKTGGSLPDKEADAIEHLGRIVHDTPEAPGLAALLGALKGKRGN